MTEDKIAKAMLTDNKCSICKHAIQYEDIGGYALKVDCISIKLTGGKGCNRWELDDGHKYVRM